MQDCELTSDRLVGPLQHIVTEPFFIKDFLKIPQIRAGYIGDTYAGKTQSIKELVFTLGGVYQERAKDNSRTLKDSSYVFAQAFKNGDRTTFAVSLKSHAGHNIGRGEEGPKADKNIVVLKYLKSSTFNRQFKIIAPIISEEGISYSNCTALITRVADSVHLTTRRKNMLLAKGFKNIYDADNRKKREYPLQDFNPANADVVLDLLRIEYPDMRLIYFGRERIPLLLEQRLTMFDNHLSFEKIDKTKEEARKNSPEESMLRAIYGKDWEDVLF